MIEVRRWARCDVCGARVMLARWMTEPLDQEHACMDCTDSTPADLIEEAIDAFTMRRVHEAHCQRESDLAFLEEQKSNAIGQNHDWRPYSRSVS